MISATSTLWCRLSGRWSIYLEQPLSEEKLLRGHIESSSPSAAVVIGARIVALLMNPILSGSFGVSTGQGV